MPCRPGKFGALKQMPRTLCLGLEIRPIVFVGREHVRHALDQVKRVAGTKENLLPAIMDAARARCTVGETVSALAEVFGRYDGAARW